MCVDDRARPREQDGELARRRIVGVDGVHCPSRLGILEHATDINEGDLRQEALLEHVTIIGATDQVSRDLRQASPFAGVLSDGERLAILRREHELVG